MPILLLCLSIFCLYFAIGGIPISVLYQTKVSIMLWILFAICVCILAEYIISSIISRNGESQEVSMIVALAICCTVMFTLLDDIITPLIYGYGIDVAIGYFYTSFLALLPQTVGASLSVSILFYPLKKAMMRYSYYDKELILKG